MHLLRWCFPWASMLVSIGTRLLKAVTLIIYLIRRRFPQTVTFEVRSFQWVHFCFYLSSGCSIDCSLSRLLPLSKLSSSSRSFAFLLVLLLWWWECLFSFPWLWSLEWETDSRFIFVMFFQWMWCIFSSNWPRMELPVWTESTVKQVSRLSFLQVFFWRTASELIALLPLLSFFILSSFFTRVSSLWILDSKNQMYFWSV